MIGVLRATSGPLQGIEFPLGPRSLIGRSGEADIQLMEQAVSRRHALILKQDDGCFWIGDLASTNGTFLGEDRVESHCLRQGDVIHLGKSTLVYHEISNSHGRRTAFELATLHLLSGPAENATEGIPLSWLQSIWTQHRQSARKGHSDTQPMHLSDLAEISAPAALSADPVRCSDS